MNVAVIGGGSWGTAMGHAMAGAGHRVRVLLRNPALAAEINKSHCNSVYLPGVPLHPGLKACTDAGEALQKANICLLALPAQHMGSTLHSLAATFPPDTIPVCLSKGVETKTLRLMSEVVAEALPGHAARYAIFSGPSFAAETVRGLPTAAVLGCEDKALGELLRETLSTGMLRVYSSQDVLGVELGGAVKNVIAIAAGVTDGLGFGLNARAALITRGLAEISRLGQAMGASPATFMGLSGMGDLVLTCSGDLSRNRQVGLKLGQGMSLEAILQQMHNVAEGVATTRAVCGLADRYGVEVPIARAMFQVLYEQSPPQTEVLNLLGRSLKDE